MNLVTKAIASKTRDPKWLYVEGIATTGSPDRVGDTVDPAGVKVRGKLKLLNQHRHAEPVGEILELKREGAAWRIKARLPRDSGLAYVDDAIKQVEAGLITSFSIGFKPIRSTKTATGRHFSESEIYEVSLVTIPCNPDAEVSEVRASPERLQAAFDKSVDILARLPAPTPEELQAKREKALAAALKRLNKDIEPMNTKAATEPNNATNAAALIQTPAPQLANAPVPSVLASLGLPSIPVRNFPNLTRVAVNASRGGQRIVPTVPGHVDQFTPERFESSPLAILTKRLEEQAPGTMAAAIRQKTAEEIDAIACAYLAEKANVAVDLAAVAEAAAGMVRPLVLVSAAGASLIAGQIDAGKLFGLFEFAIVPKVSGFKLLAVDRAHFHMGIECSDVLNADHITIEYDDAGTSKMLSVFQCDMIARYVDLAMSCGVSDANAAAKLV